MVEYKYEGIDKALNDGYELIVNADKSNCRGVTLESYGPHEKQHYYTHHRNVSSALKRASDYYLSGHKDDNHYLGFGDRKPTNTIDLWIIQDHNILFGVKEEGLIRLELRLDFDVSTSLNCSSNFVNRV